MRLENDDIRKIVNGDEFAFNRFMEHYSSRLYHYAFALLGQKEPAEEIVRLIIWMLGFKQSLIERLSPF